VLSLRDGFVGSPRRLVLAGIPRSQKRDLGHPLKIRPRHFHISVGMTKGRVWNEKLWWASPIIFGPGTPWRTWGTRVGLCGTRNRLEGEARAGIELKRVRSTLNLLPASELVEMTKGGASSLEVKKNRVFPGWEDSPGCQVAGVSTGSTETKRPVRPRSMKFTRPAISA
jgi:hypothetical protein